MVRSGSAKPLFAGSIPAPASSSHAGLLRNGDFVLHAGSIDSLSPESSPLRASSMLGSRRLHSRPRLQPRFALRNLLLRRSRSVARWRLRSVVTADDDPMSLIWRGRFNGIARAENGGGGRGKSEREQEAEGGGAFHSCHGLCASSVPVPPACHYFCSNRN